MIPMRFRVILEQEQENNLRDVALIKQWKLGSEVSPFILYPTTISYYGVSELIHTWILKIKCCSIGQYMPHHIRTGKKLRRARSSERKGERSGVWSIVFMTSILANWIRRGRGIFCVVNDCTLSTCLATPVL